MGSLKWWSCFVNVSVISWLHFAVGGDVKGSKYSCCCLLAKILVIMTELLSIFHPEKDGGGGGY